MRMHSWSRYCLAAMLCMAASACTGNNPRVTTRLNTDAALTGNLLVNPLQYRVITSWIDQRNSTMSTLYGNDAAVQYARSGVGREYQSGAILSVVTWNQQEDPRWFGARIPATPKSVEFLTIGSTPNGKPSYAYQRYEGSPLKRAAEQVEQIPTGPIAWILSQRASVMP
jgi:hypothetical protein